MEKTELIIFIILALFSIALFMYSCCAMAGRADDEAEKQWEEMQKEKEK